MKEYQNGGSVNNILMPLGFTIIAHWLADRDGIASSDRQVRNIERSLFKKYGKSKGNRGSKIVSQRGGVHLDNELLQKLFDDALQAQGLDLSKKINIGSELIKRVEAAIFKAKKEVFNKYVESIKNRPKDEEESNEGAGAIREEWKEKIGEWLDENQDILELIGKIQQPPPIQRR